jgi:hypothetical protein
MTIRHVRIIDLVTPIAAPPWPDVIERDDGKFQLGTADVRPGPSRRASLPQRSRGRWPRPRETKIARDCEARAISEAKAHHDHTTNRRRRRRASPACLMYSADASISIVVHDRSCYPFGGKQKISLCIDRLKSTPCAKIAISSYRCAAATFAIG